jgi:hypothetical protein
MANTRQVLPQRLPPETIARNHRNATLNALAELLVELAVRELLDERTLDAQPEPVEDADHAKRSSHLFSVQHRSTVRDER